MYVHQQCNASWARILIMVGHVWAHALAMSARAKEVSGNDYMYEQPSYTAITILSNIFSYHIRGTAILFLRRLGSPHSSPQSDQFARNEETVLRTPEHRGSEDRGLRLLRRTLQRRQNHLRSNDSRFCRNLCRSPQRKSLTFI